MAGQRNQFLLAIKTNSNGDTLWHRIFGSGWPGGARCIKQMPDSGFIMGGYIPGDAYLVRLDSSGNVPWTQSFRYPGTQWNGVNALEFTPDSGFIMTGWSNPSANDQLLLCKRDSIGDTLWTKTYGGSANDAAQTVWETPDQGFIILGNTRSYGPGIPNTNAYLIRTNSLGDTVWTRTYNNDLLNDENMNSLYPTSDGGYVFAGWSMDQVWVIKTDSAGDTLWTATYDIGINEGANSIIESSDGGYILTGGVKFGSSGMPYLTFLLKLENVVTSVNTIEPYVPNQFCLNQNYPNPFNPTTTIEYTLRENTTVSLIIYNTLGQVVRTLVNEKQFVGSKEVSWNGKDNFGREVSSGVYIYRLIAGDLVKSKKMILIR